MIMMKFQSLDNLPIVVNMDKCLAVHERVIGPGKTQMTLLMEGGIHLPLSDTMEQIEERFQKFMRTQAPIVPLAIPRPPGMGA